jgi:hypothetical protein
VGRTNKSAHSAHKGGGRRPRQRRAARVPQRRAGRRAGRQRGSALAASQQWLARAWGAALARAAASQCRRARAHLGCRVVPHGQASQRVCGANYHMYERRWRALAAAAGVVAVAVAIIVCATLGRVTTLSATAAAARLGRLRHVASSGAARRVGALRAAAAPHGLRCTTGCAA